AAGLPARVNMDVAALIVAETRRFLPAWIDREHPDAVDDTADDGDVAVQLARGLADHHVQCRPGAGIGLHATTRAHHAVTVHEPGRAVGRARGGESIDESGLV